MSGLFSFVRWQRIALKVVSRLELYELCWKVQVNDFTDYICHDNHQHQWQREKIPKAAPGSCRISQKSTSPALRMWFFRSCQDVLYGKLRTSGWTAWAARLDHVVNIWKMLPMHTTNITLLSGCWNLPWKMSHLPLFLQISHETSIYKNFLWLYEIARW